MFTRYLESMLGTLWAGMLAFVIFCVSFLVQYGIEWMTSELNIVHSSATILLIKTVDICGAAGSGATFILLTALQVIRLFRDVRREIEANE